MYGEGILDIPPSVRDGLEELSTHPEYHDALYRKIRGCIAHYRRAVRTGRTGVLVKGRRAGARGFETKPEDLPHRPPPFAPSLAGASQPELEAMNEEFLQRVCDSHTQVIRLSYLVVTQRSSG